MNKAILVIDMPDKCEDCKFVERFAGEDDCGLMINDYENGLTEIEPIIPDTEEKPFWCPLRSLPEERPVGIDNMK